MGIFGRRKKADVDEVEPDVVEEVEPVQAAPDEEIDDAAADEEATEAERAARRQRSRLRPRDNVDLSNGPFDIEATDTSDFLNFGALLIRPAADVEMRLDVEEESQTITGLTVMLGENNAGAVQLQAFAAPKTSGIWYGIRREIADAILNSGGTVDEVDGELGTELHVRMANQGPDGRTTFSPARFIGVDGPRWFLRAVLSGEAAVDDAVTARAMEIVRSVAVRRGSDPRAPRELLELSIPQELLAAQDEADGDVPDDANAKIARMERGPEITEIQ